MNRFMGMSLAVLSGGILLYVSRFWSFSFWSRDGLLGIQELRPNGGLLGRWLRGTEFSPFELIIWVVLVFLVLTYLQRFVDLLQKK